MVGRFLTVLGLWWLLAAIGDVLRDLHLAGAEAAVSVPDVLGPLVPPDRAAELLRVWEDWDASLDVTGQSLHSDIVVTAWLVVDVAFAIALGLFIRVWARSRRHHLRRIRSRRVDGDLSPDVLTDGADDELGRRMKAILPLLWAAGRLSVLYIVFDVAENALFWVPSVTESGVSGWLNAAWVVGWGKWIALILAVLPILVSYLVARDSGFAQRGALTGQRGAAHGYVQTALDVRAQVVAVGFVCLALLFLPGNVRPQIHDLIRDWRHQPVEALAAGVGLTALCWLTWWSGHRTLRRVEARGDVHGLTCDQDGGRRIKLVFAAMLACAAGAVALHVVIDQWYSLAVVACALLAWLLACLLDDVRAVSVTRERYERRPGLVRLLTFLPWFAMAVAWMRAETGRVVDDVSTGGATVGDLWSFRVGVALALTAWLIVLWKIVTRRAVLELPGPSPAPLGQGMRAASRRLRRRDVVVPGAFAAVAVAIIIVAAASLRFSWLIGSVGMIVIASIGLLGLLVGLTTAYFGPPRGPLAMINLTRFPIITCLLLVALVMSLMVRTPGFHKARIEPASSQSEAEVRPPTTLTTALNSWRTTHVESDLSWRPLVVVASSGGGGRAAYWTLLALDCLFGTDPLLADLEDAPACARPDTVPVPQYTDVFAASGISGGSVGLAMYDVSVGSLDPDEVFEDGFVDPVVANMLAIDVPNAWLHAPMWRDRARRLEEAFEDKVLALDNSFFTTNSTADDWSPLMVFNSAAVEDGCRVVVSNVSFAVATATDPPTPHTLSGSCRSLVAQRLAIPPAADDLESSEASSPSTDTSNSGSDTGDAVERASSGAVDTAAVPWPSTRDLAQIVCSDQNLATSTAALLSARFPYVSPSGAIEFCVDDGRFTYLVDGGTVDSSAAGPAAFMLEQVVREARAWNANLADDEPCIQPIVVQLDNGYEDVIATGAASRPSELVAPIQGGVSAITSNADTARQQLAALGTQLRQRAGCAGAPNLPTYLQVYPQSHPGTEAPLGWSLSEGARADMQEQLGSDPNQCSLLALRYWLTGSTGSGVCITGTVTTTPGMDAPTNGEDVRGPMARAGFEVCVPDPDGTQRVNTNAYGVFVHVHDGVAPDESTEPITVGPECGEPDVTLTRGATYGVPGRLALGYELSTRDPNIQRSASWEGFALALSATVVVLMIVLVAAGAGTRASGQRQVSPTL